MNKELYDLLQSNSYSGRGVMLGMSRRGELALAYFIMGRSESSRARAFEVDGTSLVIKNTAKNDPEKPELILYTPIRTYNNSIIVTNGDQTDTIYDFLRRGGSFYDALTTRRFEPDPPHFTPRISGIIEMGRNPVYTISILKAMDEAGDACVREFFRYEPICGTGHFIHTYMGDGKALPSFSGEPIRISISDDIDEFADTIWNGINSDNKVALYVRYTNAETGGFNDKLINKG